MAAAGGFAFGPYRLDVGARRLLRSGHPVELSSRQFSVLHALVSRPGEVVPKNLLLSLAWGDVAVGDNSLEKVISDLRKLLEAESPDAHIRTVSRLGYCWVADVELVDGHAAAADLAALTAPEQAWAEGLRALETMRSGGVDDACGTFERLVRDHPRDARFHIGLANALAMRYERTRTDLVRDSASLQRALDHAREGCRLNPQSGQAWSTLGFVLGRTGVKDDARDALARAVALQPDEWLNLFRLGEGSWGHDRLDAARKALAGNPGLPVACWLVATVYIARNALEKAERELDAGHLAVLAEAHAPARVSIVAFHWLKAVLCLARGAEDEAIDACDRELALEARDHVYGRETSANAWYVKGACHLRRARHDEARTAFGEALQRVPLHPLAHAGRVILDGAMDFPAVGGDDPAAPFAVERALARAAVLASAGEPRRAAELVQAAIGAAPPGNAGWLLPVEPLIDVRRAPDVWAPTLALLQLRAR